MNPEKLSKLTQISVNTIEHTCSIMRLVPLVTEEGSLLIDSKDLEPLLERLLEIKLLQPPL